MQPNAIGDILNSLAVSLKMKKIGGVEYKEVSYQTSSLLLISA